MRLLSKITFFLLLIICSLCESRGLHYEHISDGYFSSIHVLVVDPKVHRIVPVKAYGEEISRETVASLAHQYGAIAAINGGFWKLNGNPAGILKINNHWYGTPIKPRGAIGWSEGGQKVLFDRLLTNIQLKDIDDPAKIEVILAPGCSFTTSDQWQEADYIVGGTPLLISKGMLIEDYSCEQTLESFLTRKYPRTAVGIRENGDWVFVAVDITYYGASGGMTIKELAHYMYKLGCIEAVNLDGGSSSTMVMDGQVINTSYGDVLEDGKYVQAVSDAILIFP